VDKTPVYSEAAALEAPGRVGESSAVFSGTLNGAGALEIIVTKPSAESTLARVVKLVTEAETRQSPTQRFAERFERIFVPSVLVLDVVIFVGGLLLGEPFHQAFYRAMAVMVAASPCALAISTPSAVLAGIATAGRSGILVKGGGPLEVMGRIKAIAFDKTGTLTEGLPRVTDIVPAEGSDETELVRMAVAMEMKVDHPIAVAVVRDLHGKVKTGTLPELGEVQSMTGLGIRARLSNGDALHIGKLSYFMESNGNGPPDSLVARVGELEADGRSTMVVRLGERYLGAIGLMDTLRSAARETVARLRTIGIERIVMLSGDNQRVADAIGHDVGIDEALGNLMPEDKVETVARLRESGDIAMVGDGVNDAPAMAIADVGIAMGAAGSDVALETADIALMGDDITKLPFAVGLGRRTARIIKQNVFISLGMVAFLVPATIFGLDLGPAVVMHEGSTLVVVVNGLRLLNYKGM
ncbi:MAG: heavy metal translocating P-type ATPase, partial [Gemmatimonadetes bacterium]|nr:heavy metal translocating P-type ATPase [Gemmatimonadota bacterium]